MCPSISGGGGGIGDGIMPRREDGDLLERAMALPQETRVEVDGTRKCACEDPVRVMVNYSMMWGEGDIICFRCGGFIRHFDRG